MMHPIDKSEFAIHNRMEIAFTLNDLWKSRVAINLDAHNGASLLTTILTVSSENNHVLIDCSRDEVINNQIVNSERVHLYTGTGVRVRWHSTNVRLVSRPDGDVFSMPIPHVIERVQRRQYFRLNTPQGRNALVCKIPAGAEAFMEATIVDMSAGGICILVKGTLPESFSQGAELAGCSFELPEIGRIPLGLKVCRAWQVAKNGGEEMHRVGMEFVNLSRGASNVVQRYMIELEKNQLAAI